MLKVGTHNGVFHADEVLALASLKIKEGEIEMFRSRDPKTLTTCDLLVDVGGEYNGETRFDHHQKSFSEKRENGVPYASFGLVWKKWGKDICSSQEAADIVEKMLVIPIDASDSGYAMWDANQAAVPYTVSHMISSLNPTWDSEQDFDGAFLKAVELAEKILRLEISRAQSTLAAREQVLEAIENSQGNVIVFNQFVPWQEAFFQTQSPAEFLIYPSPTKEWMLLCIPPVQGSFEKRRPLPEEWAGLRDIAFQKATGVSDGIFCHPGRFICGAKTKEGALALAKLASA